MKNQYADQVRKIAYKTFEIVCYMFPLEPWEAEELEDVELNGDTIKSIVTFDGAVNGGMIIHLTSELLSEIAVNMLGTDTATDEDKEAALCEMANIICGNTVPLFSKNKEICSIHPPSILTSAVAEHQVFNGMERESLRIFLDEGIVDIILYYSK